MRILSTCFLVVMAHHLATTSAFQSRKAPPRLLSNRQKSTIAADFVRADPVQTKLSNCPFSAVMRGLENHGRTAVAAAAACFLGLQFDPSMAIDVIAGACGTYALGTYFENLKTFDGPSFHDIPGLIGEVRTEGLVNVLGRLSEKYGGKVFSCGPVAIVSKNPDNIKKALQNTKIPATTLPGLPRDAGLCSDKSQVLAACRKAFMSAGAKKEGSGRILSNVAADVRQIMSQATSDHDNTFHFQETIATPMAMATSRELVFGSSLSSVDEETSTHKREMETQNLGYEISKLFGAEGITKTLAQPWRAVSTTKNFINNLDSAISSAPAQSGCPLGKLRDSVSAGTIKQTDAISTAGVFVYFGVDTISIVSESILRILAHPDNVELQSECRREVDRVLSGRKEVISSADHARECNLLKATIAEVLRCHEMGEIGIALPPRIALRDFDLDGRTVTKGSLVMVTALDNMGVSIATGKKAWESSPSTFNPKAWLDEDKAFDERLFGKFSFFGTGAHKCPARQAGFDAVLSIIATTLSHFDDISLVGGEGAAVDKSILDSELVSILDLELVANVRDSC